jgi:copper chaperone CopZ
VCAHAVRVSLKSVPGVDTVNVSLEKGLASVTLKPGNAATLKQLGDAIAKNGFTMKQSEATVNGRVVQVAGKMKFEISGSKELLELVPDANASPVTPALIGKNVEVAGTIPEAAKGKTPDAIRYRTIVEKK